MEYARVIEHVAAGYGEDVMVKIYYAGRDMEYLKKYGMIFKGTMIINQRKKYDLLTKSIIEEAIAEAAAEAGLIWDLQGM